VLSTKFLTGPVSVSFVKCGFEAAAAAVAGCCAIFSVEIVCE
jgi:hypothetical protein